MVRQDSVLVNFYSQKVSTWYHGTASSLKGRAEARDHVFSLVACPPAQCSFVGQMGRREE